jgi:2,3-bisphosphoglycerate-independent phosphoglycerate mutase
MDGRDTDPKSGKGFIADIERGMQEERCAHRQHHRPLLRHGPRQALEPRQGGLRPARRGQGQAGHDLVKAMQESYDEGVTDEFIKPINNSGVDGTIQEGDVIIFINFRNDRAKELTQVLTQQDMPEEGMHTIKDLQYYCMTPYDANFKGVHILFPKENVEDTLGEYLRKQGCASCTPPRRRSTLT